MSVFRLVRHQPAEKKVSTFGNFSYLCQEKITYPTKGYMQYFETRFLEEANKFISELDLKIARKVFYNIDLAEQTNDTRLFKKLKQDIWEFRTLYAGLQIRLLAFWDNTDSISVIVQSQLD